MDIVRVNRFKLAGDLDPSDGDDESDESMTRAKRAEREDSAVRLYVFLTKKKAKKRMADLEETAFLLRLDVGIEGCICFGKSCGSFDQVYGRDVAIYMFRQKSTGNADGSEVRLALHGGGSITLKALAQDIFSFVARGS